jgi:hypothetical protein
MMAKFRAAVDQSIEQGINTFLDEASSKSKSLGQSFDDAMKQIMQSLAKAALQIEANQVLKMLLTGMSGSVGGGVTGVSSGDWAGAYSDLSASTNASLAGFALAEGGHVRGPGTSTSDSIPAMLSDGEFVVHAAAVKRPGVLPLLEMINAPMDIRMPRFALGGYVGLATDGAVSASRGRKDTPASMHFHISGAYAHMTFREAIEREIADQMAKR